MTRNTRRIRRQPRVRLLPYKMGSQSAKNLANGLGIMRIYPDERSRFVNREQDTIINWGASSSPIRMRDSVSRWLNHPSKVAISANKTATLECLTNASVPTLDFTTSRQQALEWLLEGKVVIARTLLNSHSGRGIIELDPEVNTYEELQDIPNAPLYTLYKSKKHEYRVHVLPDDSVAVRQKRRRMSAENINWRIRNHVGGFIFAHELSYLPSDIEELAVNAKRALGLDFCALDILYNERDNKSFVIESNTSPGLEGSTLQLYVDAFRRVL